MALLAAAPLLALVGLPPNTPTPPLPVKPPGLLLLLLLVLLPWRPYMLLLPCTDLVLPATTVDPRDPGCARTAAAAAAVGEPRALKPPLHPASRDAPVLAMLLLLLVPTAGAVLLLLPAPVLAAPLGEPASTGSRMCASSVEPVGDCGLPGPKIEPLLLPVDTLPGLGDPGPLLLLLPEAPARALLRARLLNPAAGDAAAAAVCMDRPTPLGLLLLLLAAPLPNRRSPEAVLAADHPADPVLAALAAPVPLPAPNAPDAVLLLPPTLYPAGPAWLLPALLPVVALLPPVARDAPGPLLPASRPAAVLLPLPALASARASTGLRWPFRSALTAAHSAVNLRPHQTWQQDNKQSRHRLHSLKIAPLPSGSRPTGSHAQRNQSPVQVFRRHCELRLSFLLQPVSSLKLRASCRHSRAAPKTHTQHTQKSIIHTQTCACTGALCTTAHLRLCLGFLGRAAAGKLLPFSCRQEPEQTLTTVTDPQPLRHAP